MTRILIVEDEPSLALALEDDLQREGYDTQLATDGDTGERLGLSRRFDLILLDLMLPKRDGSRCAARCAAPGSTRPS